MANDGGHIVVCGDLAKDPLSYCRVILHDSSLIECERTLFAEQAGRKAHLPDVVYKSA